jgi:hypothetical protein
MKFFHYDPIYHDIIWLKKFRNILLQDKDAGVVMNSASNPIPSTSELWISTDRTWMTREAAGGWMVP